MVSRLLRYFIGSIKITPVSGVLAKPSLRRVRMKNVRKHTRKATVKMPSSLRMRERISVSLILLFIYSMPMMAASR